MHNFIYHSKCLCEFLLLKEKTMNSLTLRSFFHNLPCSQLSTFAASLWPLTKTYLVPQKKKKKVPKYTIIPLCLGDSAHSIPSASNSLPFRLGYPFHSMRSNSDFRISIKSSLLMHSFFLYSYFHSKYIILCFLSPQSFEMSRRTFWGKNRNIFSPQPYPHVF